MAESERKLTWERKERFVYAFNANGHNALQFSVTGGCHCPKCKDIAVDEAEAEAWAEFIAMACNSHYGLLKACGKMANLAEILGYCSGDWTNEHRAWGRKVAEECRAAIAATNTATNTEQEPKQ